MLRHLLAALLWVCSSLRISCFYRSLVSIILFDRLGRLSQSFTSLLVGKVWLRSIFGLGFYRLSHFFLLQHLHQFPILLFLLDNAHNLIGQLLHSVITLLLPQEIIEHLYAYSMALGWPDDMPHLKIIIPKYSMLLLADFCQMLSYPADVRPDCLLQSGAEIYVGEDRG